MKTLRASLAALAAIATITTITLVGCGQDNIVAPVAELDSEGKSEMGSAIEAASGKALFEACQNNAVGTLSLGEVVALTPYLNGSKTEANMTASLEEAVRMTPIIEKFRRAFDAEIGALPLGEVIKVTSYMTRTGKSRFPYPELGSGSGPV